MRPDFIPPLLMEQFQKVTLPSVGSLWLVFAVIIFIYSVFSFILTYHWRMYAFDPEKIHLVTRIYFSVSGIIILGMAIFLAVYGLW